MQKFSLAILLIILLAFTLLFNLYFNFNSPFSDLAWSFLHGKVYFIEKIFSPDLIFFHNHYYWHMPPLPAIILMPFIFILKIKVSQGWINLLLNLILFGLIYYLANKKFNFSKINSIWLAVLYLFSSVHIGLITFPNAWNFAQTIATLLIFLSLLEFFSKKRFWLIGILVGLVFLSRYMAGLVAIFYLLSIFFEQETWQKKLRQFAQFLLPIFFCGLVILSYNYLRFSNPLTTGYKLTWFNQHYYAFSTDGQFNLKYIPTNLYYYFLESFRPNYLPVLPGQNTHQLAFPYIVPYQRGSLSFFIISPLFLLLFKADYRKKINKQLLATAFIILFILLCYYYNGHYQIGPRYFNDFLPLLFIILLSYFQNKEFNDYYKLIIIISIFLNFYIGVYLLANTDLLRI